MTIEELLERHPLPPTPMGDKFVLHDWQKEDILTLIAWDRVGVFLPVGAGKTVCTTLVALAWGHQHRVVILPPILIDQWVKWINKIPNSGGAAAYQGSPKQRGLIDLKSHSWWIMSNTIFKNDFDRIRKLLEGTTYCLLVDEAQNIKNSGTDIFKKAFAFSAGQGLALMTGTELNDPADAYAYVKIKTPGVYRSFGQFANIHVAKRDFFDKPIAWRELDLMNRNLYLQSVQRTKEEVHAHLPKANYIPFPYKLAPAHQKLYDQLMEEQLLELEQGGKVDATTQGSLYNFSQQLVLNWAYFADDPTLRPTGLDVVDMVRDAIELGQPKSSKLIIWSWFRMSTKLLYAYMDTLYPGAVAVAFSESNSQKEVARFMDDPGTHTLVAQPGSAGAGLNPQYVCWASLFMETPTRTIQFRQAAGRVDREGQRYNANIWIAQAEDTIQVTLYNNLLSNDSLVQKVQGNVHDLRKIIHGR